MAKQTQAEKKIQQINNARAAGLISPTKARALRKQVRQNSNASGNVSNTVGKAVNQATAPKTTTKPAPPPPPPPPGGGGDNGGNPGFLPGGAVRPAPLPTENYTNAPMPTESAGDGMQWSPVYTTDSNGVQWITEWVPIPIPGYVPPVEPGEETGNTAKDRAGAKQRLEELMREFGIVDDSDEGKKFLQFLYDQVEEWGANNESTIMSKLRGHAFYKARFKGNEDRIKNGYKALDEATYITIESDIRKKMRAFGLTDAFYTNGRIATLIGGDVSSDEVGDRLTKAKKIVDSADTNIKGSLTALYGASLGDLIGYVLDPALASEGLTRKINAGIAYGVAKSNDLTLSGTLSEQVGELTYGDERSARQGLGQAGVMAQSVRRLQGIETDWSLTDDDIVEQQYGLDEEAGRKVKKLQSRERARFSGTGGAFEGTLNSGGGY